MDANFAGIFGVRRQTPRNWRAAVPPLTVLEIARRLQTSTWRHVLFETCNLSTLLQDH
jgi:hypothetical protein